MLSSSGRMNKTFCNLRIFGENNIFIKKCRLSQMSDHKSGTVDLGEIEKHSNLQKEWWDPNGPMKALHTMNEIRVPLIRDGTLGKYQRQMSLPLTGFKILDVGCGGGILSEPLSRLGAEVTGLDASKDLIELAKFHAQLDTTLTPDKLKYVNSTIEDHAVDYKEHYDSVVASEIIEHVSNKKLFIESCISTLKPGGSIFFTTPNKTYLSWLGGIVLAENVLNIVPKGLHDWNMFITPAELSFLVEKNDCKVKALYGAFYSFFNNKWYLCSSKEFLFILHAVKYL